MKPALGIVCVCIVTVAACAAAPDRATAPSQAETGNRLPIPTSAIEKIDDLKEVEAKASELPRERTLVVFDIDDTLLTTPLESDGKRKFFGSDRWYVWQAYGLAPSSPDRIGDCLFEVISTNASTAAQVETQEEAIEILARMPNDKLMLTSRSPNMKDATAAQLKSVGYKGIPSLTSKPTPLEIDINGRAAIYDNGVFLTQGAHKGDSLVGLLDAIERDYDYVILVDDTEKNVLNMAVSMALQRINYFGFRYTLIKNDPPLDVSPEQVEAHQRDWKEMLERHPEHASRWKSGECK